MDGGSVAGASVQDKWVQQALGHDVSRSVREQEPGGAAAPHGEGKGGKEEAPEPYSGHQTNPFDAPEVHVEIERLALPKVQQLAEAQAQNARADFLKAIETVKAAKKAAIEKAEARKEMMMTVIAAIVLMPAGPVLEAVAAGLAGPALRNEIAGVIANNAGALEAKYGMKGKQAAEKAFDLVTSERVAKLAEKFDHEKAKSVLEKGTDLLKERTIKFAASDDHAESIASYLDALMKSANDSMHNLTNAILTTDSLSGAIAYYNLFSMPLQASYEAVLSVQVDHMMEQLNDALAQHGEEKAIPSGGGNVTMGLEEIVSIDYQGRKLLAHVTMVHATSMIASLNKPHYGFQKWITPDMQETAAKMVKAQLTLDDFKGQHIPNPILEPGQRIVLVQQGGKARLMLIEVEDKHGFFSTDYGVCTFKQWAESEEEEQAFRSRGAIQNGGINTMDIGAIKKVPG